MRLIVIHRAPLHVVPIFLLHATSFRKRTQNLNSCANPVGSKFFFEARYKWGGLRHLYSEEHMKPTAAEQTGMKQQDFEALFSKYRRLVYRAAYSVAGNKR